MSLPARDAIDEYLQRADRRLAIIFDLDVGELIDGHRVVVRGLEFGSEGAVLHYEFVPALERRETEAKGAFFWYWMLGAEDDVGTHYEDWNNGASDDTTTGAASHGERDLGGQSQPVHVC